MDAIVRCMLRRPSLVLVSLVALLGWPPIAALAQPDVRTQRIAASFVLALGRVPTAAELERWAKDAPQPLADLVARHRKDLKADPTAVRAVILQACRDAFGRAPGEDDFKQVSDGLTYVELMDRHLRRLEADPSDYEQVLHRAYRLLLDRDAYPVEITYWKRQSVLSFALVVGCVDDWARRNRPGLTATTGVPSISVNSAYLATVRLAPAVAAEAREAAGMVTGDLRLASVAGQNIVAPGASRIVSVGGIYFAAAGAPILASVTTQ